MPYGDDGTVPLDPLFRELISRYSRRFQGFSFRNRVYCVPVDAVKHSSPVRMVKGLVQELTLTDG